jgi:HSP20 family protein
MAEQTANQKSSQQRQSTQPPPQSAQSQASGQSQAIERRPSTPGSSLAFGMPQLLLDPFSIFRSLSEEMNRMLAPSRGRGEGSGDQSQTLAAWVPTIEIEQRDGKYIVSAELPGIDDTDVTVEVDDDVLVIQGERQYAHEETEGGVRRTERRYGQFYRAIPLPDGVDTSQAEGRINNGVLEVSFPMTQSQNQRKQIPVSTQQTSGSQKNQSGTTESTRAA